VGHSERADADVDYTFVALGVKDDEVDFSANCGNITSAVGPWAWDHGLMHGREDGEGEFEGGVEGERGEDWVRWQERGGEGEEKLVRVRIHNTNTGKIIHSTFPVIDGEAASEGSFAIDGVAGTGAKIELAFMNPALALHPHDLGYLC
jgi:2-methylaconitate cis-trans-isomerase PrpF